MRQHAGKEPRASFGNPRQVETAEELITYCGMHGLKCPNLLSIYAPTRQELIELKNQLESILLQVRKDRLLDREKQGRYCELLKKFLQLSRSFLAGRTPRKAHMEFLTPGED